MGISALHQALKALCLKTDWSYAVFWKLNSPGARMMLTCEDAYYDQNDPSGSKPFDTITENLPDETCTHDLLGLALNKMSYHQYSLGDGIIGQIAVTNNHFWISGDQIYSDPCLSFEDNDGWRTQFAAGIRTVAFVAIVPHGVVQLGSLKTIAEDLKMVNHIRDIFLDLQTSNLQILTTPDEILESKSEIDTKNEMKTSFNFPAGCELYEALGPAFCKQKENHDWLTIDEIPGNLLTPNSGSENLLEAVVGTVSQTDSEFSNSVKRVSGSGCYSFETYGSSLGFSSASHSRCSEPLERVSKKRARPGQSSRPRPRDRQLIQDRIKELRELVPNGSKCSIDSLLERTIKHMLFMQCVTKHANKIDKYAESKLLGKEAGVRGPSSHEQGSSWAMEVGNHMKVCPVTVENIGTNGQMLVEMMCEEGVHFLEIADAIRSLGLVILKGVSEPNGDKIWMCFVVEGQNNRNVHRMDILWLLVQILQSKEKT